MYPLTFPGLISDEQPDPTPLQAVWDQLVPEPARVVPPTAVTYGDAAGYWVP